MVHVFPSFLDLEIGCVPEGGVNGGEIMGRWGGSNRVPLT